MKKDKDVLGIISQHLGNVGSYKEVDDIDKSLLVKVPRKLIREKPDIIFTNFSGYDVWNAYEFSTLRIDGFPVTARLKIVYDCSSEFVVESKSLKLYLHSFNFAKLAKTSAGALRISTNIISTHLSSLLNVPVAVKFFTQNDRFEFSTTKNLPFIDLDRYVEQKENLKEAKYEKHDKNILKTRENSGEPRQYFATSSMRSNCRVTHQPDWATAFIGYEGKKQIDEESLLRYILSMRKEDHFHEEACELLFNDIYEVFKPKMLAVTCLYTRRGGIDINPVRFIGENIATDNFKDAAVLNKQEFRQ